MIDIWVQNFLYNFDENHWTVSIEKNSISHFIFYDGIKLLLKSFEILLLLSLIFLRKNIWIKNNIAGLFIVFLSLIIVPSVASTIKGISNVACPSSLTEYGGKIPYTPVLKPYPEGEKPAKNQRCFPAGHASGGFALLSLFFLATSARQRKQALALSLTTGWLMGGYKMLAGHHFLSHTIISMMLAWLIVNIIVFCADAFFIKKPINKNVLVIDNV
uniref:phosphatase PAP2 family protein n=1 Tax=Marinobacterium profundum TaxID=1714300 RepID=UPI001315326C|nr:phosphatase PAP2 family protein [Marinobacterium profundum]